MLKIFLNIVLGMVLGKLKEFALSTISGLNSENLTDSAKREQAFKAIKERAKTEGRLLRDSLINLALEMAVTYLKKG